LNLFAAFSRLCPNQNTDARESGRIIFAYYGII
jgi:hypothetical protein